jgi:hypothetical protein
MSKCQKIKIKTTWNIIKHETGKQQQMEQIPPVLINNEKVNDPQKIADAFNTFFLENYCKSILTLGSKW